MKNKNKKSGAFGAYLMLALIGVICGLIIGIYLDSVFEEYGLFASLLLKLLIFMLTYFVQLIIHEVGHLIAGLLSGYSFGSFRVGSVMLVKDGDKLKIKRQTVAGTGGQCLMIPPEPVDGRLPVILYNLGGVLLNLLTLPLCVLTLQLSIGKPFAYAISVLMFLSGLLVALTNGIPLKLGMINNDGSNARELYKNSEAQLAFYNQFMILDKVRNGARLRDIPKKYFPMPTEEGMNNSVSASAAVFLENYLFDCHKFDEAGELIDKLLYSENALIGMHRNLLVSDKIVIKLLKGETEAAKKLYNSKRYQNFKNKMKISINIIRTDYAFALLCEENKKRAENILAAFDKSAEKHPYQSDVVSERDIISVIDEAYKNLVDLSTNGQDM